MGILVFNAAHLLLLYYYCWHRLQFQQLIPFAVPGQDLSEPFPDTFAAMRNLCSVPYASMQYKLQTCKE